MPEPIIPGECRLPDDLLVCANWPTCLSDDPDDMGCDACRAVARSHSEQPLLGVI